MIQDYPRLPSLCPYLSEIPVQRYTTGMGAMPCVQPLKVPLKAIGIQDRFPGPFAKKKLLQLITAGPYEAEWDGYWCTPSNTCIRHLRLDGRD